MGENERENERKDFETYLNNEYNRLDAILKEIDNLLNIFESYRETKKLIDEYNFPTELCLAEKQIKDEIEHLDKSGLKRKLEESRLVRSLFTIQGIIYDLQYEILERLIEIKKNDGEGD